MVAERGSQQSDTIYLLTRIHPRLQTAAGLNSHDNVSSLISNSRNTLTVGPVSKEMVNLSSSLYSSRLPSKLRNVAKSRESRDYTAKS